jgi:hypothetical protein
MGCTNNEAAQITNTIDPIISDAIENEWVWRERSTLEALIEATKGYVMTDEEREAQRRSWVVGELMLDSGYTREEAEAGYKRASR